MKKVKYILATLLFITSLSVIAESWYQVEIIIFDRINPNINEEKWSNEDPIIIPYIIKIRNFVHIYLNRLKIKE